MTSAKRSEDIPSGIFFEKFLENLANPVMIWDHAFRNQLSEASQHLVLVMGTLGDEVRFCDLETAFHTFYSYRQKKLGFPSGSRDFANAVKELDGNFIKTSLIGDDRIVTLHNPSLSDFLESYFLESSGDLLDLIESAAFFDQFVNLWKGRRGNRYNAFIGRGAERLIQVLSSKLKSIPSCQFVRYKIGIRDVFAGVKIQQSSLEHRMAFLIDVSEAINTVEAKKFRMSLLDELTAHLQQNGGNKEHLITLLRKIAALAPDRDRFVSLLGASTAYLLSGLSAGDLEDFEALAKFIKAFPGTIQAEELGVARTCFLNHCEGYDESSADSPDDYWHMASTIELIAMQLDAEVSELCDDLRTKASEWEEAIASLEEDETEDDYEESRPDSGPDTSAMFEELLDELNERTS